MHGTPESTDPSIPRLGQGAKIKEGTPTESEPASEESTLRVEMVTSWLEGVPGGMMLVALRLDLHSSSQPLRRCRKHQTIPHRYLILQLGMAPRLICEYHNILPYKAHLWPNPPVRKKCRQRSAPYARSSPSHAEFTLGSPLESGDTVALDNTTGPVRLCVNTNPHAVKPSIGDPAAIAIVRANLRGLPALHEEGLGSVSCSLASGLDTGLTSGLSGRT